MRRLAQAIRRWLSEPTNEIEDVEVLFILKTAERDVE